MEEQKKIRTQEDIHAKGFDIADATREYSTVDSEFKKIKVGVKSLDDAILNLGTLKKNIPRHPFTNKRTIYKAIIEKDYEALRAISKFFYETNGIYKRVCDYFAFLYRFDWYVAPEILDDSIKEDKILKDFSTILNFLDSSYIKSLCGEISLEVIKNGCYYAYIVPSSEGLLLQQLPPKYCRSRYKVKGLPAIEFNMAFFDTFSDINYRMKILNLFPEEFKKGYTLFKKGKLPLDFWGDTNGWYLLDPASCVKFNFNGSDVPLFINTIPTLLELDAAQDLDRRKQMQQLLKVIIQKLPLDKNGDLIFDNDEARDIHNNAVMMLQRAIGVDVLTTFADVDSIDMSDNRSTAASDDLARVERTVYNNLGVSKNIFNTDSNLALEKSILNDESTLRNLLLQFNIFFNRITQGLSRNKKKYSFRFYMLETTQYNYKELADTYKQQVQLGYSKMLPQIALGHSQSFILNSVKFENELLHLSEVMIPPLTSNTINAEDVATLGNKGAASAEGDSDNKGGRPEKADGEKSEKTIANKESM